MHIELTRYVDHDQHGFLHLQLFSFAKTFPLRFSVSCHEIAFAVIFFTLFCLWIATKDLPSEKTVTGIRPPAAQKKRKEKLHCLFFQFISGITCFQYLIKSIFTYTFLFEQTILTH